MKAAIPAPLRLLSFWLGLPVFLFLLWAWRDSIHHAAVANWAYGKPFVMMWPPFEPPPDIKIPSLDRELPTPDFPKFDLSTTRAEGMSYSPSYSPPHPIIDTPRNSSLTGVVAHRSIGSKAGALWISSWISPSHEPWWSYRAEPQDGSWFPPCAWKRTEPTRNTTAWIPYWLLTGLYALAWAALLLWRGRRQRKHLADLTLPVPPDGTGVVPRTAHHP